MPLDCGVSEVNTDQVADSFIAKLDQLIERLTPRRNWTKRTGYFALCKPGECLPEAAIAVFGAAPDNPDLGRFVQLVLCAARGLTGREYGSIPSPLSGTCPDSHKNGPAWLVGPFHITRVHLQGVLHKNGAVPILRGVLISANLSA